MQESKPTSKLSSLMTRVCTAAILIVVLVLALAIGGRTLSLIIMVCLGLSLYEELHALRVGGHRPVWWTAFAALVIAMPLMRLWSSQSFLPLMMFLSFCALFQVMQRKEPDLLDVMVSVLPMLTIVLPGMCLFGLMDAQQRTFQLMLFVFLITMSVGSDTCAYFVGCLLGKHKLCPVISPKKTVEGAIGGLMGSVLFTMLARECFMHFAPNLGNLIPTVSQTIVVSILGGIAAQMGDLFASMVKRHCKVKDFGHIFPGHGGMLDRLDSILFTAIVVYCFRILLLV